MYDRTSSSGYEKPEEKTLYHGGFSFLDRIHRIFMCLDEVSIEREVTLGTDKAPSVWRQNFSLLNVLFKELQPKMETAEREKYFNALKIIQNELSKACRDYRNNNRANMVFFSYFDEYEMELRIFAESKGLLMPSKPNEAGAADDD